MAKDDKPNKGGRPTELTPEIQEKICDALAIGNYIEAAAAYAGVSKVTVYAWMKRGNKDKEGIYFEFINALLIAREEGELKHVTNIDSHSKKDWKASAWMLSRTRPGKFSQKSVVAHVDAKDPFDLPEPDKPRDVTEPIEVIDSAKAQVVIYIPRNSKEVEPDEGDE